MIAMTKSEPYKLFRGRPPKDLAWSKLVDQSTSVIENDETDDESFRETARLDDQLPRGCSRFSQGEEYYCKLYLGRAQRHIAKGTLYQCAKFYDYALIYFDKYRVRKAVTKFNFDRADDVSEMLLEPQISEYLAGLEKYLLESGDLVLPEVKSEARKEKQRTRSYKKTIAGTIETWMNEFQPHIFELADQLERIERKLDAQDEIKARLAAIEEHLKNIP